MADFVATVAALRTRLEAFAGLPLYWPNDARTPSLDVAPDGFVYSEIRHTNERPMTLGRDGDRVHRDFGELVVYVYVPAGSHTGAAEAHAQTIRNLFRMTAVPDVICTRRTIGTGGNSENKFGRFWSVPVVIDFHTDRLE